MHKAEIIRLPDSDTHWITRKHKIGDVVDVCDSLFDRYVKCGFMVSREHYKEVTISREKCPNCGHTRIVREKVKIG